jgi:hypothetical protein
MLETRIVMSLLIFRLILLLVLCLISFMEITIAHMVLVHEKIALCLDALVTVHVLIVVIVPRVGTVFLQEGLTLALSQDTCMVHISQRGSRPTLSNGEVQKTMKTSSGRMVKCWIPKFYLTNHNTESSTSSRHVWVMDGGLENKWLMDSDCSRHMTENKKWFSSLTTLSHKEYVTFGDDKKGKVLGTGIIRVNDYVTLNDVTLVDKLRYNLLSVS